MCDGVLYTDHKVDDELQIRIAKMDHSSFGVFVLLKWLVYYIAKVEFDVVLCLGNVNVFAFEVVLAVGQEVFEQGRKLSVQRSKEVQEVVFVCNNQTLV